MSAGVIALLNIGGHFGMEPRMAARAAQSVRAKLAIPQHFATFPGIAPNAAGFALELKRLKIGFYEMKPGETIAFRGRQLVTKRGVRQPSRSGLPPDVRRGSASP